MQNFLSQPEATFYHITTMKNWTQIQKEGLVSNSREIFVSRVGELPVLLAILFNQLFTSELNEIEFVFIKIPQSRNQFNVNEISPDNNARDLWTQPFQNIIHRNHITIENIELMMALQIDNNIIGQNLITLLNMIAQNGENDYRNHNIFTISNNVTYS